MTPKQIKFCLEYVKDLNASQAAIRAGYSKNRNGEIGYQLLQKTAVKEEIQKQKEKIAKKTEITIERIVGDLEKVQKSCFDENDNIKDKTNFIKSTELLGKIIGAFVDKQILKDERTKEEKEILEHLEKKAKIINFGIVE